MQPSLEEILGQSKRPSFIHGLRMEEISGVNHPAHEQEGWTVLKSRKLGNIGSWNGLEGDYAVVAKSVNSEKRYTLGLLYAASNPGEAVADAHGESITSDELYNARLNYVKSGDRTIHLQHGEHGIIKIGEWIDIIQWPDPVEAEFKLPGNKIAQKVTIPANSVWVGIEWNDTGWPLIKAGELRGLSLGGFRRKPKKAKETGMAKQEEPIKDPLEGYAYEPFTKAMPDPWPNPTNTGPANQPLTAPKAPVVPGSTFGPAKPRGPLDGVTVVDHKPRLDRRFKEFLQSLEAGVQPDRYRAMLMAIANFNDRALEVVDQAGHIANLKQLASDLRKIKLDNKDIARILRMGRFILPEGVMNDMADYKPAPHGLGDALTKMIRRGMAHNVLSNFDPSATVETQETEQDAADKRTKKQGGSPQL